MKLNFKKLRQDIHSIENKIRFLRANHRISLYDIEYKIADKVFMDPSNKDPDAGVKWRAAFEKYWDESLPTLKDRATILYSIRANNHARLHREKIRNPNCSLPNQPKYKYLTKDDQETLVAQHVKNYELDRALD